ncbi:MAG: hypothetical protein A2W11_13870 [Ignavibacteria bacterium RBG_16_35_7]|nr:MAG: hypothetical protein A2W11_13870 [Ignavibacteria bacterium RBG_16_35_7]
MKNIYSVKKILSFYFILFFTIIMTGCKDEPAPTLFDNVPITPIGQTPVINSVSPDSGFAGVTEITINGSNFSSNPGDNLVYFNGRLATILNASPTQLIIKSPGLPNESMTSENTVVKIAVLSAELFSNSIDYKLLAAVSILYPFPQNNVPTTISSDDQGNIYTSLMVSGAGGGIKKITPSGEYSDYAPRGIETSWSGLKFGPDGILYAAKKLQGIWQIFEGVQPTNAPWVGGAASGLGSNIVDINFDTQGNIWAVGNNKNIYRIKPDKSVTAFPFDANLRTVKIFNNSVYVGGIQNSIEGIWKLDILLDGTLGSSEEYFNFSNSYSGKKVNAITFAQDGDLYIGTDAEQQIIIVHPNKEFEPLYSGLLKPSEVLSFAWDNSTNLYYSRAAGVDSTQNEITPTIIRMNVQKQGVK